MRQLRYSINVTLDGCCDHRMNFASEEIHRHATENLANADALIFGRITFDMMESAWRERDGKRPEWVTGWMLPFAQTIHNAKKYVISDSLEKTDWNSEIVRGPQLEKTVRALKQQPGKGLFTGGLVLPRALAELGLIDEYEFIVHPMIAGHGPTLFSGLSKYVDLQLVDQQQFRSGAMVLRYVPRSS